MKKVQNTRYKKFPVNETATRSFLRSATASRHVRVKHNIKVSLYVILTFILFVKGGLVREEI